MLTTPHTPRLLACLVTAALLSACGGGDDSDTTTTTVALYKRAGSVQCGSGGLTLSGMERELVEAGVRVITASCGNDGTIDPALCGLPDGQIGIFEVAASHAQAASVMGYVPLSNNPAATSVPCTDLASPAPKPNA
ncbi:MAG: hypothetical protein IV105_01685 [Rhizobacter sp.]|nr:hypothetical protein [Rhizobacter sp.]